MITVISIFPKTRSYADFEFGILVIGICPSTWLRVVSLSNHLRFDFWCLEFHNFYNFH